MTPHVIDPKYPGAVDEIINLGDHWNEQLLREHREEIIFLTDQIAQHFQQAYVRLREARGITDEWANCLKTGLDSARLGALTAELIEEIFQVVPRVRHLFATAITPAGPVNFMDSITEDCTRRYILRGQPGCGKSAVLQQVGQAALKRGYSVDLYHCGFDPDELDAVIIPALKTAVVDGSSPHVVEPRRPGDKVLDLLELIDSVILYENSAFIAEIEKQFEGVFAEGVAEITTAKRIHDDLERFYVAAMDFSGVDQTRERLLEKILHLAAEKSKP